MRQASQDKEAATAKAADFGAKRAPSISGPILRFFKGLERLFRARHSAGGVAPGNDLAVASGGYWGAFSLQAAPIGVYRHSM